MVFFAPKLEANEVQKFNSEVTTVQDKSSHEWSKAQSLRTVCGKRLNQLLPKKRCHKIECQGTSPSEDLVFERHESQATK